MKKKRFSIKRFSKGYKTNTNTKCTLNFFLFFLFVIDSDIKLSPELSRKLTRPWTLTEPKNQKLAFIANVESECESVS